MLKKNRWQEDLWDLALMIGGICGIIFGGTFAIVFGIYLAFRCFDG